MKSIMHNRQDNTCYLCVMLRGDYSGKWTLEEHHVIYGTANRRISEKYGLKVYLCPEHHRTSREAVHQNRENDLKLKRRAQEVFERVYPTQDFRKIFGMNYRGG